MGHSKTSRKVSVGTVVGGGVGALLGGSVAGTAKLIVGTVVLKAGLLTAVAATPPVLIVLGGVVIGSVAIGGVTYTGMKAYDRIFNPKENEGESSDIEMHRSIDGLNNIIIEIELLLRDPTNLKGINSAKKKFQEFKDKFNNFSELYEENIESEEQLLKYINALENKLGLLKKEENHPAFITGTLHLGDFLSGSCPSQTKDNAKIEKNNAHNVENTDFIYS